MTNEQMILTAEMARPGFQLIMVRLQEYADEQGKLYDQTNFVANPGEAMRIQITRDIIKNGIPRILEKAMNADKPKDAPRWSFKNWFRSIFAARLETGGK